MDDKPPTLSMDLVTRNLFSVEFNSLLYHTNLFYVSVGCDVDCFLWRRFVNSIFFDIGFLISGLRLKWGWVKMVGI